METGANVTKKCPYCTTEIPKEAKLADNFDKPVLASISREENFRGISQELLKKGKTTQGEWQLSLFDNATKIREIRIVSMHYTDTKETMKRE